MTISTRPWRQRSGFSPRWTDRLFKGVTALKTTLVFYLVLGLSWTAAAGADNSELLKVIERAGFPADSLSLLAVEQGTNSGNPLLAVNAHRALNPASVTKLITAATVLRELPIGTRFETRLLSEAPIEGATLTGDLILKGGGDPSFVSETLWLLANRLAQTGIRNIAGDVLVDDRYFDDILLDPSRNTKPSEMAYDAPVNAMAFNWNAMAITIRPGDSVGSPARVFVDPPSSYVRVDNHIRTVAGSGIASLYASRRQGRDFQGDVLTLRGDIGINANPYETYRNVTRPALWAGSALAYYLELLGIEVTGDVRHATVPAVGGELTRIEGRPVEQLVSDMNKVSSNFIAAMLVKNLAARRQPPGSMATGMEILEDYMASLGIDQREYYLRNPSGLTRLNRLSAAALVRVLEDMTSDFRVENEFMASLPIAGIDGTLHNRMTLSPAKGWVRAKTGYLRGAVSLAGYAGRDDGSKVIFAFLYNGPAPAYRVRALFDELSALLVEAKAPPPQTGR